MAQTRLTWDKRQKLNQLASRLVVTPEEDKAIKVAYRKAAPLVRAAVEARYPHKDMLICKKYSAASIDDCIKVTHENGLVTQFIYHKGKGPLAVKTTQQGVIYQADAETFGAVEDWIKAQEVRAKARDQKMSDYRALVNHSRTYEQVLSVWPEAEAVRTEMGATALIVLSDDVVDRIKADVASRKGQKPALVDADDE